MNATTESRNRREGRYAGWRATCGRNWLIWPRDTIGHERAGQGKTLSLRRRKQLWKEARG